MERKIVDIEAFQKDVGLDYETMKELYLVFAEEIAEELKEVEKHLSVGSMEELSKTVHNIKGISSSYRTEQLYAVAREFDVRMKARDHEELDAFAARLVCADEEALEKIYTYFGEGI